MAFPQGWNSIQTIMIDHTKMAADETNFPVPLVWTGASGTSNVDSDIINSNNPYSANADGSDIRASSDALGQNQLPVEVVLITKNAVAASARLEIYVNVSSVSSSSNTVIYLWYGNSTATMPLATDTYGRNAVWTNHLAVYHMTGAGDITDSTGNGHTAVNTGSASATGLYNAASARLFDNSGNTFFTISGLLGNPAALTVLSIVNATAQSTSASIPFTIGDYEVQVLFNASTGHYWRNTTPTQLNATKATSLITSTWGAVSSSVSPAVSHEIVYVNASASADGASAVALAYTGFGTNTFIGKHGNGSAGFNFIGSIEEIRVLSTYKASTWHTSTYNSVTSPNSFIKQIQVLTIPSILDHAIDRGECQGIMKGIG
jgi:hypothetical protein